MAFTPDTTIRSSFKNIEFLCTNAVRTGGRNIKTNATIVDHKLAADRLRARKNNGKVVENPSNDFVTIDIGITVPTFKLTALFHGDDYIIRRDELIDKLDDAKSGELEFPGQGTFTVVCKSYTSIYESTVNKYQKMDIEFVLFKPPKTFEKIFLPAVTQAAEALSAQAQINTNNHDIVVLQTRKEILSESLELNADTMKDSLSAADAPGTIVGNTYDLAVESIDALAASSDAFVDDIALLFGDVTNVVDLITTAFDSRILAYETLLASAVNIGNKIESIPEDLNQKLTDNLYRTALIVGASKQLDFIDFASVTDVENVKNTLFVEIDDIADNLADFNEFGETYQALVELRSDIFNVLSNKLAALPNLIQIEVKEALPAEVLAYQLYGDATRGDDIVERNNIKNSLFVEGILTVLSE